MKLITRLTTLILCIAIHSTAFANDSNTKSNNCIMLAFGDSITYGMWEKEGGWVERLRRKLDQRNVTDDTFKCLLYNMGIPGDTARGLKKRIDPELQTRVRAGFDTVVLIAIGINDSVLEQDVPRTSLDIFKNDLEDIIHIAKKYTSRIALLGLNPVDESKVRPLPNGSGIAFLNARISQFNDVIMELAKDNNSGFIDLWQYWHEQDYESMLQDGLHPNERGHEENALLVEQYLKEQVTIEK